MTMGPAYLQAGYSPVSSAAARTAASRLAKHPLIAARVQELRSNVANVMSRSLPAGALQHEITAELTDRDYVRRGLRLVYEASVGSAKKKLPDARSALRALDQLARASGMYRERDFEPLAPAADMGGAPGDLRIAEFRQQVIRIGIPADVADRLAAAARGAIEAGSGDAGG